MTDFPITRVRSKDELSVIASLFSAYATWLNIDLTFQDFANELANLPGRYAQPRGEILLARGNADAEPLGCIAIRPLAPQGESSGPKETCEIKRLYVVPAARGMGVGRGLVSEGLNMAKALGYKEAKLETLPRMRTKFMKTDLSKPWIC